MLDATLNRLERGAERIRTGEVAGFDLTLIYAFALLALTGLVLSFAAGPVAAARIGITDSYYFTQRHILFLGVTVIVAVGTALLTPVQARRLGILAAIGALAAMVLALLVGPEIKGAQRWLHLFGFSLQPSEFLKPGFICAAAWFLSARKEDGFPGALACLALYGFSSILLLLQPDYGQWILLTAVWAVMVFVAGWSWAWIFGLGSVAAGALGLGYLTQDHVRARIDRFIDPSSGDTYQISKAAEAISAGGVFGHDLHEAPAFKQSLPDAHTDFVYAVAVEEFGLLIGLAIIALFVVIAARSLKAAIRSESMFMRTALSGLAAVITLQATINIGVNVGVLPAKGMTLPLISSGGSSMVAMGFTAGLLLAFSRKKPS